MRSARRLFVMALLGVALLVPVPAQAARTLALSAGSFKFEVSPGQSGDGEVLAINEGDEELNVLVYVADQTVSDDGKVDFVTPNRDNLQQSLSGPSGWVRIEMPERAKAVGNTPYIVLKPGERVPVKFAFDVPAETPSGDHNTVLFFEMFTFENGTEGVTSKVQGRVGSRLKVRVKGTIIERLVASPFWVKSFVTSPDVPFRFTIANDGNIDKRVNAAISLLDRNGEVRLRSDVATDAVLYAGTQRRITGEMTPEGTLIGPFTVRLNVDYEKETEEGGPGSIVEERAVWIVPMWLAIAAAGLLVFVLLWMVWRIAIRAARRKVRRERSMRRRSAEESSRAAGGDAAARDIAPSGETDRVEDRAV